MKCQVEETIKENGFLIAKIPNHPFKQAGGGQPCDLGKVTDADFEGEVTDVISTDTIKLRPIKGTLQKGEAICEIDEKRRETLTRMHTGEHILFKSLEKYTKGLKLEKIRLEEHESTLNVLADTILWNHIFAAERLANQIIKENRPVNEQIINKDEAEKIEGLRIKAERIKAEAIRVIEIEGFDFSACTGTHCKTTGEVGGILVTALRSAGPGKFEIKFKTDINDDLFTLAEKARATATALGTETDKMDAAAANLKEEIEKYKKAARKQKVEAKHETINEISFHYSTFEDADKKHLINQAKDMLKDNTIICFINQTERGQQLMLMSNSENDAAEIINHISEKFNGKGGGNKEFAMCSFEGTPENVINEIKKRIGK